MGISSYVLFTTPSCVSCVPVREHLKDIGLKGIVVDASEGDGRRLATENGVRSVPVVYFYDENNNEVGLARSVNEIKSLMNNESVSPPSSDSLKDAVKIYNDASSRIDAIKNHNDASLRDPIKSYDESVKPHAIEIRSIDSPKDVDKIYNKSTESPSNDNSSVIEEKTEKVKDLEGNIVFFKQLDSSLPIPEYKTEGSVGLDLYARESVTFAPRSFGLVLCNIVVKTPKGFMLGLFSRSSTAFKKGLIPANGVGVIDQDYCGDNDEIKAPFFNSSDISVIVEKGERVSQLVFIRIDKVSLKKVDSMDSSSRGGFGSTGMN